MDPRTLGYWIATGLFCAVLAFSGFAHFTQVEMIVEAMTRLGYPLYFMSIIGLAKMCGVVALLVPGRPLLKEWAYAGFAFNLIGATASHAFSGDHLSETIRPAIVLLIGVASYALRPGDRRLPVSFSLGRAREAVAVVGACALLVACGGPFLIIPGGELSGQVVTEPVEDWSSLTESFIDLETRPDDPYSVQLSYIVRDGKLYIDPLDGKNWLAHIRADPRVRARFDGKIYPLEAVLVGKPGELEGFDADRFVYRLDPR